ncbi:hypothetical protein D0T84_12405 [Dysgonomonas sp. 521]|uniref:hypothetical protein n=1 Tax=Dysgonomonas sp. 521 TaxID=2302932 RepID=UPI0013D7FB13|nr:hypothetical protein [Dysgonomonas sp. 521]NDV95708.1 hypothetical protein [Dysgonomonas sp. 521]
MKRTIIILIIILVAASCNQASKNNADETTDTICEGAPANETFNTILQQLGLECKDCYLEFVSEQTVPANEDLTIWVIPKIISLEKDNYNNESFSLDCYVLLADTKTGKVVSRHYTPDAYSSDAYMLTGIGIDTLDYRLNDNKIIFGISSGYNGSSGVNPSGHRSRELFVQQNDSLLPVLSYTAREYRGENDGGANGNGWFEEYNTRLVATDHKSNGFPDLTLFTDYKFEESEQNEVVRDSISSDSIQLFRYTTNTYKGVKKIEGTVCEEIRDGYGKKKCYYFGKTLAEVYQIIYKENENSLQRYMQPELPSEDLEYKMITHEDVDSLTINYNYKNKKNLNLEFSTDMGVEYCIFNEKENCTIFIYDYHD